MSCVIIAEAGVNHNGDLSLAKELIDTAASAGADFVKFQTFKADKQVAHYADKAQYQKQTTAASESQYDMLKRLEMSDSMHLELRDYCQKREVKFLSTAFDLTSINYLASLKIPLVKVPSGEITNLPLLLRVSELNLPVVLSTGMATIGDIDSALSALTSKDLDRDMITLLHCTTEYPAPMNEVNLNAMVSMRHAFGLKVGYSDHTTGIEAAIAAVALGASVIEKHFTLDRNLAGPDHQASLEPEELVAMVSSIRNIELALGNGLKYPSPSEQKNAIIARKSIVASRAIKVGEVFTEANITTKRPGAGISPMRWYELLGKIAQKSYEPDELIQP